MVQVLPLVIIESNQVTEVTSLRKIIFQKLFPLSFICFLQGFDSKRFGPVEVAHYQQHHQNLQYLYSQLLFFDAARLYLYMKQVKPKSVRSKALKRAKRVEAEKVESAGVGQRKKQDKK